MTFGLNVAQYSHIIKYQQAFAVYFKIGSRHTHLFINERTDPKLVMNLLWALELPMDVDDPALTIFTSIPNGKEIYVFLHYQEELGTLPYTFLHIPGTMKDGRVFDRKTCNYIAYTDNDGSLVHIDPVTKDRSLISRNANYMKSMHIKAQGKIIIQN